VTDAIHCEAAGDTPPVGSDDGAMDRELRWRDLVQALPAAIYITDAAGRITFFNEAAATLWGREPELGRSEWCGSWRLYWPDGTPLPHDECPMAVTLRTGRPVRGVQAVAERPDGSRVPFMPYPTPLYSASGQLIGAVNLLVDLTVNERAAEASERLAAIVESSDDAIVSKDLNSIVRSWNGAAQRLFGYSADEIVGKPVTLLIPPDKQDEELTILQRIRGGQRIEHYETVRRRKDGTLVHVSLSVSPIKNSAGRIVGASKIARDITERKEAEARQALLARELHHRTKNLFAVVQAVVSRSFAGKRTVEEAQAGVLQRLHALGQAHVMLVDRQWQGVDLLEVAHSEMRPFSERVTVTGPALVLSPQAAQSFALALHELATNATKYGALSAPGGRVDITWSTDTASGSGKFKFHWREHGGPTVAAAPRKGFGSTVLEQVMAEYAETPPRLQFSPDGVVYEVSGRLADIAADASSAVG
jgi:two-component system, chemotaxis family, CheB/CheR fusion protein